MWLRNGGNLRILQLIMGHASIKTTEMHLQLVQDDMVREQARFAPTSTRGSWGRPRQVVVSRDADDGVSDRDPFQSSLLPFDPVALVQGQADRDTRALVQVPAGLPQAEVCVDLPSGRPPKELPQVIAAMVNVDDAGFTLPLFADLPDRRHQRRAPGANGENPDVNYSECKVRGETLHFERRHARRLTFSGPELLNFAGRLPNFHGELSNWRAELSSCKQRASKF